MHRPLESTTIDVFGWTSLHINGRLLRKPQGIAAENGVQIFAVFRLLVFNSVLKDYVWVMINPAHKLKIPLDMCAESGKFM
jgi:hypothetical protein